MLRISTGSLYPVFYPRAWGNLVKTCQHILTISLLKAGRAIWTLPRLEENQKNFRRMLAHPKAADGPTFFPRAGGNLIQTHHLRLNDFLLQRSRAVEL